MNDTHEKGATLSKRQGSGWSSRGHEFARGNEGETENAEQQSHNQ